MASARVIPSELGNPALHAANLVTAVGYVIKGADAVAANLFKLQRLEADGRVIGKRCGTVAKLHQTREQIVRHVHVNDGGQAIVADQVNHYAGGGEDAKSVKQSHAAGTFNECSPMPCPDAARGSLQVASGEGAEALPDARRHKPRRSKRQSYARKHGGRSAEVLAKLRFLNE